MSPPRSADPPAPDDVAPGRRQRDLPEPGEQGPGEQDGRPDPGAELQVERFEPGARRVQPNRIGPGPLRRCSEIREQREHGFDIANARDVVQLDDAFGQQRRSEDRQRGVLVARRADRPSQRPPAANAKT